MQYLYVSNMHMLVLQIGVSVACICVEQWWWCVSHFAPREQYTGIFFFFLSIRFWFTQGLLHPL